MLQEQVLKGKRRLLFLLSDGEINDREQAERELNDYCRRNQIEMVKITFDEEDKYGYEHTTIINLHRFLARRIIEKGRHTDMEGLLKCPHGLVTGCEERQGLKIYRHLQDGEACGLLNGLQLTPEEILLEMGQTFVSSGNFAALAPYVRGGELAEGYVPPQASTALNEFLLFSRQCSGTEFDL